MTPTIRRLAAGIATVLVSITGTTLAAHASAAPPWEPDATSQGGLTFYDASGHAITGGSLSTAPIAAYVVGGAVLRSGDTKATLYGYLPVKGEAPGAWSGEQLSASTTYPASGAPGSVSSTSPVVSGASTDTSLASLVADYPNKDTSSTDGYAGIYQLRLVTSAAGQSPTATYDSADIAISGNSWSVVYSAGVVSGGGGGSAATATKTTLAASTAKLRVGKTLTLKAKVTPAVAGRVTFYDGSTKLAVRPLKAGTATFSTAKLAVGAHKLHASFAPKSPATAKASTSRSLKVIVTKA